MCSLVVTSEKLAILETGFSDATVVLALPEPCRRRLREQRTGWNGSMTMCASASASSAPFPSGESAIRPLGAVLIEWTEQRTTGHRSPRRSGTNFL
jgi:hypothetical protein